MTAADCHVAMDMAEREKPDAIVLNHRGTGTNGIECIRRIKKNKALKKIPVSIVVEKKNERKMYLDVGADNVLIKPISHEDLVKTVSDSLDVPFRMHPRAHVNILVKYENLDLFLTNYASTLVLVVCLSRQTGFSLRGPL
jgi:DNA-binding response OmpR family regulator